MHTIIVPDLVALVQLDGSPVLDPSGTPVVADFSVFVRERTCDPSFGGTEGFTMQVILAAVRVSEACTASPGTSVKLDSSDWERLNRSTKNPNGGYHPAAARCFLPHMMAIVNATEG